MNDFEFKLDVIEKLSSLKTSVDELKQNLPCKDHDNDIEKLKAGKQKNEYDIKYSKEYVDKKLDSFRVWVLIGALSFLLLLIFGR